MTMNLENLNVKMSQAYSEQFFEIAYFAVNKVIKKLQIFALCESGSIKSHQKVLNVYLETLKSLEKNLQNFDFEIEKILNENMGIDFTFKQGRYGFKIDDDIERKSSASIQQQQQKEEMGVLENKIKNFFDSQNKNEEKIREMIFSKKLEKSKKKNLNEEEEEDLVIRAAPPKTKKKSQIFVFGNSSSQKKGFFADSDSSKKQSDRSQEKVSDFLI